MTEIEILNRLATRSTTWLAEAVRGFYLSLSTPMYVMLFVNSLQQRLNEECGARLRESCLPQDGREIKKLIVSRQPVLQKTNYLKTNLLKQIKKISVFPKNQYLLAKMDIISFPRCKGTVFLMIIQEILIKRDCVRAKITKKRDGL